LAASTACRTSRLVHELGVWSATNAHRKISTISGQELLRVTASILIVVGQERKIFSSCCSTGELLLHFLKVIITANLFLSSPTLKLPVSAYDAKLAERREGAYRTSRINTLSLALCVCVCVCVCVCICICIYIYIRA